MIRSVLFVTTELSPFTPGGAGVLIAGLVQRLRAAGLEVDVLLAADVDAEAPGVHLLRSAAPHTARDFSRRSKAIAVEVARLAADGACDLIEFHDFDGIGFSTLTGRHGLGLESVPIAIRFHGPVDLQVEAAGVAPRELEPVREMERSAYGMADLVIAPSPAIGRLIEERYGVDRLVVGWPPVDDLPRIERAVSGAPEFAVVGRLAEVKGSSDLVEAAVALFGERPDARFRFIGGDGWSAGTGRSMQTQLESMIPDAVRDRIIFEGPVERQQLAEKLATPWAVVVPSRFESFCLAAHEARRLGVPLIVPDLPAFRGILAEETGALVYDGTVAGLRRALARMATDPAFRDRLESAPAPMLGDPLEPYLANPPRPRHPQAQAGLATAAANRWEDAMGRVAPGEHLLAGPARRLLRILPEPIARLAVRVLPGSLKDRFREVASWPEEEARRVRLTRRQSVEASIAAGRFAESESPAISVVIPVYNDASYLMEAVVSVFEASRDGAVAFEVIVVDDGSTEAAACAVIDGIDWPRVQVIRQENRGLPGARNTGIRAARGAFVVPLDSDDLLGEDYLFEMAAALDKHSEAAYAHCWAQLFGDVERFWQTRPFNPYQLLISNSVVGCVMMRRSAWEAVGGYDETMVNGNEDWELWVRFLEAGFPQVQVPMALFHYRKHGTSMSVETEARFEEGRQEIVARHPRLFAGDRLRAFKATHYPLVSLIATDPDSAIPAGSDIQVVRSGDSLAAAVGACSGKYVAQWDGVTGDPETLGLLARALEDAPDAAAVHPAGSAGPVMWRRWVLFDASATPERTITAEIDATGPPGELTRGMIDDPLWTQMPAPLAVQRQRPEADGSLPDWMST
jgi:glycosyltransferase involved in cell wall biosynthesis/GT2 family glycosyltransferase